MLLVGEPPSTRIKCGGGFRGNMRWDIVAIDGRSARILQILRNILRNSTPDRMAEIVLAHVSERSVLGAAETRGLVPFRLGDRQRYATCSGVAWFGRYRLAVVNLYGGRLRLYRFHPPRRGHSCAGAARAAARDRGRTVPSGRRDGIARRQAARDRPFDVR
jgi:hypothetical protein